MHKLTKKLHREEHYIRYLISYVTVLLIPLIILTIFYSSRFMKKFYAEIYETVDLELVQMSTQLENELESMQNISEQLAITGTIRQAAAASSPYHLQPVITYLSGFASSNAFIEDIVLIPDNNDYITTSTTTCEKDYYFDRIFKVSEMDNSSLQELIQNSSSSLCIPRHELASLGITPVMEDIVIFLYPLYTDYQRHEGTVLFYVKSSSIENLISPKLKSYHAQIYITDREGTVITGFGSQDNLRSILAQPQITSPVKEGGAEYVVRRHQSIDNGWAYYAFIPNRQTTFSQASAIMRDFILAIIIIILLASVTIYFLQKVNYAPVRRLLDKAKQVSPEGTPSDELTTISNALDFLSMQNSSLSSKLEDSLTAVKNEKLHRLLSGDYPSKDDFNLDCSELELSLPNAYFSIGILMVHAQTENLQLLAQEIKKQLQIPYIYYYLHSFHPNQIILLMNLPEKEASLHPLFSRIQTYLSESRGLFTTIGVGSVVDSTERIAQSYMEAASALDYRFVKGNGTIIEFKEVLGPQESAVVYPHQEFEVLRNALLSQNEQNIYSAVQNIIGFMEQRLLPLYLARSICFDLIHLVNEHCRGMRPTVSNSPLELSGMETAQEIIQMLRSWSESLKEFTTPAYKKIGFEEVIRFVDDNCLNCDFSAYDAAEHFEMTLPAFSKFFKDHAGQNVMDYTIYQRMKKAKELLRTTNLPLKEIAEQVGYYNISSFTRRFKLNQGITPSDYRKSSDSNP